MRKPIIETATGLVVNVVELEDGAEWTPPEGHEIGPAGGEIGDTYNGHTYAPPVVIEPPPTLDDYKNAIQELIDQVARKKDYADGFALATYKDSPVQQYADEAAQFIAWRDPLWPFVFQKFAEVQNGIIPQPTVDELLAMLPPPPWPLTD